MLAIIAPEDYNVSRTADGLCYTELQPVTMDLTCLVSSSNDPCLPEFEDDVSCVEYVIHTEDPQSGQKQQDCFLYSFPDSPESLIEEECTVTEEDLLQIGLYEESRMMMVPVVDDEEDDASVMLDLMDLSFLDEDLDSAELDNSHCFTDSLDTCATVTLNYSNGCQHPDFRRFTPSPFPPTPIPSPTPSPALSPTTTSHPPSSSSLPTSPSSPVPLPPSPPLTLYFCDTTTTTVITPGRDSPKNSQSFPLPQQQTLIPATVEDSALELVSTEVVVGTQTSFSSSSSESEGEELSESGGTASSMMDFDEFDDTDDENDEDADFKPYCNSRRGAKKNLLWKFLLWNLDNRSDIVRWTDIRKGVFKFVDTNLISTLWGQRKKKTDMTFEKLSRGIRHYYKRGLMERLSHTRLMYKFNWDKVPKRYRKA